MISSIVSFGFKESFVMVSFFFKSKESFFTLIFGSSLDGFTESFFNAGITVLFVDFISCAKPIFVKKKTQNKSMYDRFDCNALNTIFV
jgi:hypothetical protein